MQAARRHPADCRSAMGLRHTHAASVYDSYNTHMALPGHDCCCCACQDEDLEGARKQLAETQQTAEVLRGSDTHTHMALPEHNCCCCACQDEDLEAVHKQLAQTQQTAEALQGSGAQSHMPSPEHECCCCPFQDEDLEAVRKHVSETQQTAEALLGSGKATQNRCLVDITPTCLCLSMTAAAMLVRMRTWRQCVHSSQRPSRLQRHSGAQAWRRGHRHRSMASGHAMLKPSTRNRLRIWPASGNLICALHNCSDEHHCNCTGQTGIPHCSEPVCVSTSASP